MQRWKKVFFVFFFVTGMFCREMTNAKTASAQQLAPYFDQVAQVWKVVTTSGLALPASTALAVATASSSAAVVSILSAIYPLALITIGGVLVYGSIKHDDSNCSSGYSQYSVGSWAQLDKSKYDCYSIAGAGISGTRYCCKTSAMSTCSGEYSIYSTTRISGYACISSTNSSGFCCKKNSTPGGKICAYNNIQECNLECKKQGGTCSNSGCSAGTFSCNGGKSSSLCAYNNIQECNLECKKQGGTCSNSGCSAGTFSCNGGTGSGGGSKNRKCISTPLDVGGSASATAWNGISNRFSAQNQKKLFNLGSFNVFAICSGDSCPYSYTPIVSDPTPSVSSSLTQATYVEIGGQTIPVSSLTNVQTLSDGNTQFDYNGKTYKTTGTTYQIGGSSNSGGSVSVEVTDEQGNVLASTSSENGNSGTSATSADASSTGTGAHCEVMASGTGCAGKCDEGWKTTTAGKTSKEDLCPDGEFQIVGLNCRLEGNKECSNNIYCYKCDKKKEKKGKICYRDKDPNCQNCEPDENYDKSCDGSDCNGPETKVTHNLPQSSCGSCNTEERYCNPASITKGGQTVKLWRKIDTKSDDRSYKTNGKVTWNDTCQDTGTWCCLHYGTDSEGNQAGCESDSTLHKGTNETTEECYEPLTCAEAASGNGRTFEAFTTKDSLTVGDTDGGECLAPSKVVAFNQNVRDGWCKRCLICDDPSCNVKVSFSGSSMKPAGCSGCGTTFMLSMVDGSASATYNWNAQGQAFPMTFGDYEKNKFTLELTPSNYVGQMDSNFAPAPESLGGSEVCTVHWWNNNPDDYERYGVTNAYGQAEQNGRWILYSADASLTNDSTGSGNSFSCSLNSSTCQIECEETISTGNDVVQTTCDKATWQINLGLKFIPDLRVVLAYDGPGDASDGGSNATLTAGCEDCYDEIGGGDADPAGHQLAVRVTNYQNGTIQYQNITSTGVYTQLAANSLIGRQSPELIPSQRFFIYNLYGVTALGTKTELTTYLDNSKVDVVNASSSAAVAEGYWSCVCPEGSSDDNGTNVTCQLNYTPKSTGDKGGSAEACMTKRTYISFVPCTNTPWFQASGGNMYGASGISDNVPMNSENVCVGADKCLDNSTEPLGDYFEEKVTDYVEVNDNLAANLTCTPRMIRGKTPCKASESNSSGIALTSGTWRSIQANKLSNGLFGYTEEKLLALSSRITERSSEHALNPSAVVTPTAATEVGSVTAVTGGQAARGSFTPRTENYQYFASLFGGEGRLKSDFAVGSGFETLGLTSLGPSGLCRSLPPDEDTDRNSEHTGHDGTVYKGYINYICYVNSNLKITNANNYNWRLQGSEEESNGEKYHRKVTVFIDGNLTLGSEEANQELMKAIHESVNTQTAVDTTIDDEALTMVDVDNFLAFIVSGDIIVNPTAGINMPLPIVNEDRVETICWEGQNASIPYLTNETNPNTATKVGRGVLYNTDKPSSTGVAEGIFVANGKLHIRSYHYDYSSTTNYEPTNISCKMDVPDKRFIGQGSFIAWDGVKLDRNFDYYTSKYRNQCPTWIAGETESVRTISGVLGINAQSLVMSSYNNRVPAETFIYRPDLVRNAPSWMKASLFNMQVQ